MKKSIFLLIGVSLLLFVGCSQDMPEISQTFQGLSCGKYQDGDSWMDDCNRCSCLDGKIVCTMMACPSDKIQNNDSSIDEQFKEFLDTIEFNTNLEDFEKEWLGYLQIKYPHSKIYHIRTKEFNCENCYEVSYKRDLEVIKIKVLDGEKKSETKVTDDIAVEIDNEDICTLFKGNWNECPKLCPTDEITCQTECGLPVCEFDYNTIEYKKVGEQCGGLEYGDCEFGLRCYFESQDDESGICQNG
jgi:hypothetical protein